MTWSLPSRCLLTLLGTMAAWADEPSVKPRHILKGHVHYVRSLSFSEDGKKLLSSGNYDGLRLWDVEKGKGSHSRA
jgi:WD40 repeat protein